MSILIKGIDLPKNNPQTIVLDTDGKAYRKEGAEWIKYQAIQIYRPHGRLIDASELDKCWEEKEDISEDVDYKILYKCVLAISKYAPTILEAEE